MRGIPTVTVEQLPAELPGDVTVLDVRETVEWAHGHVPGSVHIPLFDLPARMGELPVDGRILVVCKVGARSAQAVAYLVDHGLDAINLDGGLMEWHAAGRPLVTEHPAP